MSKPAKDNAADAHNILAALDAYLNEIQLGSRSGRARLLEQYPELAQTFNCLEALESLAAVPNVNPPVTGALAGDATTVFSDAENLAGATRTDDEQVVLPKEFGDYELLGEIGRGGMGVVYRARQKSLDRVVALKVVLGNRLASEDSVRRFKVEAKVAAGLHHPNIVRVYEAGQAEGLCYLAMEMVEGSSLDCLAAAGPMEPETAARCVATVAHAVEHLHTEGVVHRDLKPSNILIDEAGRPYVTDFGLAKMFDDNSHLTQTGDRLGTASYMSPEQAAGRTAEVGPLSDVYSLGAILYELLTGRAPFRGDNVLDILVQVVQREPESPRNVNSRIPRSLAMICQKCLEKSPGDRYTSAGALADDLQRYLKDEEVEARKPKAWDRLRRWVRREPALSSRLIALAGFCMVELFTYHVIRQVGLWTYHVPLLAVAGTWALASIILQQLIKRDRWPWVCRFAWAAVDAVMLLAAVMIADGAASGLIVVYPLLIVTSGLWFRVRLVWFMTVISVLSYITLALDFHLRRVDLMAKYAFGYDRHLACVLTMLVLGAVVSYQVRRVRALSHYYEQRRLP